ncbi:Hypothetical predicted protein [Paramuricea clavata]|uniref:Uncharacterized protein n=1 Tax=Paramuricea clavata TaxID=317549 RepID=A0A7D9DY25_PARCT|nr:Hypothetical predicted protein [Paramuricea clavata]
MEMAQCHLPSSLDLTDRNLADSFKKLKRQLQVYMEASGNNNKPKQRQTAIILHCAGPQVLEVYDHFEFEGENDKNDPVKVFEKLEEYCNPRQNEVLQSFRFWQVPFQEPFDTFLTKLYSYAESCNFKEKERMIRDKIVFTVTGKQQELLLGETSLDIKKAKIEQIAGKKSSKYPSKQHPEQQKNKNNPHSLKECNFCVKSHEAIKTKCPAWGKLCNDCKGRNHFEVKCKKVHTLETKSNSDESDDSDTNWLATVEVPNKTRAAALMQVKDCDVRFQLDTGADVNTLCQKFVRPTQVEPTTQKLIMWNKSKVNPLGETTLKITNPKNEEETVVDFIVVPNDYSCLLGLSTIQQMGLLTINDANFIAHISTDANQLGSLGETQLHVDPYVPPRTLPCRKLPLALQENVKEELNHLVEAGVLVLVEEPTVWVSQMAVVKKPNGSLRICIDPQPLNAALQRGHYKLPTLDDVLPSLSQARMGPAPIWAQVSSEIQRKLNEALVGLNGVICIADDLVVYGSGNTREEADADHEQNLLALQERCAKKRVKLNDEKTVLKQTEIKYMGHLITNEGVKADKSKVEAILDMPAPTDVHGVKRLCGMIQYLAKFLPNLAGDLQPIRELTKKDVEWNWSTECQEAFQKVKEKITNTPLLAYFDSNKELLLQVDSSKDGLGAALMQDGKPIEYASRALTPAERNWAQIEKETLAVVFGLERFDQYTYGRKVIVQNDHNPLTSILKKPLSQIPKRLQALMLRVHRYDIEFHYIQGSQLVIADTLSRAFLDVPDAQVIVMKVNALKGVPDEQIREVQAATAQDQCMQSLLSTIKDGWPESKKDVQNDLRPYFDVQDTLSHQNGIILKGERIVIPASLRDTTKKRLHSAHLGYDSMMRRARDTIFWPGMAKEVRQLAENCKACLGIRLELTFSRSREEII